VVGEGFDCVGGIMNFTVKEIAAFFKNLETQEFTGPFGPDWSIRKILFAQGCEYKKRLLEHERKEEQ
jgi:hypothetical protein